MKFNHFLQLILTCSVFAVACSQKSFYNESAGNLRLVIDETGKITTLEDVSKGINYLDREEPVYLLECLKYGTDSSKPMLHPESMKIVERNKSNTKIELDYKDGISLTVLITPKKEYFRMELIDYKPDQNLSMISWGPYYTTMKGQAAEWLGLNRSNDFTIGLLTLEPHTDGEAARFTKNGSSLQLLCYDNTRERFVGTEHAALRKSVPVPGLTIAGSAVALFGCPSGKENELGIIEKIELNEGLPHPMFAGKWNKVTKEGQKLCIWTDPSDPYGAGEKNFSECLKVSKEMGARILCRMHGFSKNWGHFDIDPDIYPGGINSVLKNSTEAKENGMGLTLYTLTTFIKPHPDAEPYLAPVPDDRLQTWKFGATLKRNLSENSSVISLHDGENIVNTLNAASSRVIRIGNELIEFKDYSAAGDSIIIRNCERGAFFSGKSYHPEGSEVTFMYVAGFHNFYPGTLEMSNEIADKMGDILLGADLDNFVVDGFESCLEAGYGNYTGNVFLKRIYDRCIQNKKELLVTGSGISQYTWHILSHLSWGEYDWEKGFRGTMLDYRLHRQLQLKRNLVPNKLGQYYPDKATAEDISWLMALAAGWDSGIDFNLNVKNIQKNPEYNKITETLHLWQEAISAGAFSEEQKMALRQTDVLYDLSRKTDGTWDLKFNRFWKNEKLKILPSSVMPASPVNGGEGSVKPCSIDWTSTHNPGFYNEAALSDDLVHKTGSMSTSWKVYYPAYKQPAGSWNTSSDRYFQFVIRLAKDAPCAVSNLKVSVNDQLVEIPVTLQPGQYIAIPYTLEMACIYDENNNVIGEIYLHGSLPVIKDGTEAVITISCEPADQAKQPDLILNLMLENGFFYV